MSGISALDSGHTCTPGEITSGLGLTLQATCDLCPHVLFVESFGLVFGGTGDVGVKVIPVLAGTGVEVCCTIAELRESGVEVARHITGHRGAKEDPLCLQAFVAEPIVGAAPKNTVRARRLVSDRWPNSGLSLSMRAGSEFGPSTSASMIAFHESWRYCVSSAFTFAVARGGIDPGMINGEASSPVHSAWITVLISRRTPRVRWKRSRDDHSS